MDCTYTQVPFSDHIRPLIEPNAGAHYYVESEYNSRCFKQSCIVDLAQTRVDTVNSLRRAYICFSMVSKGEVIQMADIGLGNYTGSGSSTDSGWFAMSWAPRLDGSTYPVSKESYGYGEENPIPAGSKIKIEYTLCCLDSKTDRITGSFFNLTTGGNEFARIVYEGSAGSLFESENNLPLWRCKRFMSLIPTVLNPTDPENPVGADIADGSYLKASMEELTLHPYHGFPTSWGDGTGQHGLYKGDICFAWMIQTDNIPRLEIGHLKQKRDSQTISCCDIIHIFHRKETHR